MVGEGFWSGACFLGFEEGPLVPVKGNVNATLYKDIIDNCVLPTRWQQFGEGPLLFQHDCTFAQCKVHKNMVLQVWCGGSEVACTDP